jgi:hypothetical protein
MFLQKPIEDEGRGKREDGLNLAERKKKAGYINQKGHPHRMTSLRSL